MNTPQKSCYEIETPRLILRQFALTDIPAFVAIYGDAEEMTYMGKGAKTPEQSAQSIKWKMKHWAEHGYGLWCAVERSSSEIIGHCGVAWLQGFEEVEVAYLIARSHWGQGLATEAVKASLAFGFDIVKPDRIIAIVRHGNIGSERVATKCGMRYCGDAIHDGFQFQKFSLTLKEYLDTKPTPSYTIRNGA